MLSLLALGLGFFLDLLIGDPHWLPHPVRWMGWFIKKLEPPLRNIFPKSKNGEICAGTILVIVVIIVFTVFAFPAAGTLPLDSSHTEAVSGDSDVLSTFGSQIVKNRKHEGLSKIK